MSRVIAFACVLLIPVALAIGWGVGQLPTPEPRATPVEPSAPDRAVPIGSGAREPARLTEAAPGVHTVEVQIGGSGPDGSAPAQASRPPDEPAARDELSQWTTLDLAIAESRRTGKPVMIDFNADWCLPCRRMKREVFDDGAHAATVQTAVIPVSIVDGGPEIEDLQRRYRIDAFPTLVVFSPETGREERDRGYSNAEATVAWITSAARSVR